MAIPLPEKKLVSDKVFCIDGILAEPHLKALGVHNVYVNMTLKRTYFLFTVLTKQDLG